MRVWDRIRRLWRRGRVAGAEGFAVIDVETTGLLPDTDRVIEIAVVRTDRSGRLVDEWTTLLNPGGSVGATFVHGISSADVRDAPTFAEAIGELNARLAGRTVVGHNAAFDVAFVRAEYARAGWTLPDLPILCTLEASQLYLPELERRRLVDCCWAFDIPLTDAHSALGDTRATAVLLGRYLDIAHRLRPAPDHLGLPARAARVTWPAIPVTPVTPVVRPPGGRPVPAAPGTLWTLLDALPLASAVEQGAPVEATEYLELLFEVLEDGVLTEDEARSLAELARVYALTREQVDATHRGFLLALAHRIVEDGRVTKAERTFLTAAAGALGVEDDLPQRVLQEAMQALAARRPVAPAPLPPEWASQPLRAGQSVAFTGCDPVERAYLEGRAVASGLRVSGSVSRLTAVLVTDGANPHTTKAQLARALATPVVSPAVFAALVDAVQPAGPSTEDTPTGGTATVRAWAREHGLPVGVRGRVSLGVLTAYHHVTGPGAPPPDDRPHDTPAELPAGTGVVWLDGVAEVQVAGESFHRPAIRSVQGGREGTVTARAVLVPEPAGDHDCQAVAVYLDGRHVGYVPGDISRGVRAALTAFAAEHSGHWVGCAAEVRDWDNNAQVILLIDLAPLGLSPLSVVTAPPLAARLRRALTRLDEPAPQLRGEDPVARAELAAARRRIEEVDRDHRRSRAARPALEADLRGLADRLTAAGDPQAARAWLDVAHTTRFQSGRSADTIAAFVEALRLDRADPSVWCGLIDYLAFAPHAATLVELYARVPRTARPEVLAALLAMSYGQDRSGQLAGEPGAYLRRELLALAEREGDGLSRTTIQAARPARSPAIMNLGS